MSPVPLSPMSKMAHPIRTSSHDSNADSIRKRVCKACDRCRLKKSKCDGLSPCTRCKADNAICVFGERKKSHDKVYPKGYVEMLEQQQGQLVAGLQKMYSELRAVNAWSGPMLEEPNGQPLTHDILNGLGLLEPKQDGSGEVEAFEEDYHKLQSKLLADGAGYMQRRGSVSSDSEHSQHGQRSASNNTPTVSQHPIFQDGFNLSCPSSPVPQSPAPKIKRQSYREAQPSPLQQASPLSNDPQLFQAEWAIPDMSTSTPEQILRSKYAMQSSYTQQQQEMNDMDMYNTNLFSASAMNGFDSTNFGSLSMMTSYQPSSATYGGTMEELQEFAANNTFDRVSAFDPMAEVEFSNFVQVTT